MIQGVPASVLEARGAVPAVRSTGDQAALPSAVAVTVISDRDLAQEKPRGAALIRVSGSASPVAIAPPGASVATRGVATLSADDVATHEDLLVRYRAMSNGDAAGLPAALMAAAGNDPRDGSAAFATYLEGRRVGVPQAAILAAAGVTRRADIGTSLADYGIMLRYDDMPPTGAAMFAATRMNTGADYEDMYNRYRGFRSAGKPHTAAVALATAELESGNRDDYATLSARLRSGGFSDREAGVIAGAMLRAGLNNTNAAFGYLMALRSTDVPVLQRTALIAAGLAGGRRPYDMAAAYDWFAKNGVGPDDAAMLAAGWAVRGSEGVGVLTTLAAAQSL